MKKKFVLFVIASLLTLGSYAQGRHIHHSRITSEYNKWSIEGGIGLNKPRNSFTAGYAAPTPGFFAAELGARYMINSLFGFKLGFDYNRFQEKNNSPSFKTNMYGVSLQGVANAGRLFKFEEWTNTLGLLLHAGVGASVLSFNTNAGNDNVGNGIAGLTVQIKASPKVAINLDGSAKYNFRQNTTFDGRYRASNDNTPMVFNGTIGISYYIGKKASHADWSYADKGLKDYNLDHRVSALEGDKQRGRKEIAEKLDANMADLNRRVDELENKIATTGTSDPEYNKFVKQLIDEGFINIFFDFNSVKIDNTAANSISFIRTYMMRNPGVRAKLSGFADEIGPDDYNQKLSLKRANAVADLLEKTGIEKSRLETEGKGKYLGIDSSSDVARRQARKVTFYVK